MVLAVVIVVAWQNKNKTEDKSIIKAIAEDTLSKTVAGTADLSEVLAKDDKTVELIRKKLQVLLKKDLPAMTKEQRFFYYETYDLNDDKKNEYFVGFSNSYFCESGGCSGYILNNDGSVINSFIVTEFPIFLAKTASENFQDLIFKSNNSFHLLKMKNGKYPSNPSVQEIWKENVSEKTDKILDMYWGRNMRNILFNYKP